MILREPGEGRRSRVSGHPGVVAVRDVSWPARGAREFYPEVREEQATRSGRPTSIDASDRSWADFS